MNKIQEIYKFLVNRLDNKFQFFIYDDIVAEYIYGIPVVDIFVFPLNMINSELDYLKKIINEFEANCNIKITNGLFGFKNKSIQIKNVPEYISLVVCGHDTVAGGILENFRYQISKSDYNNCKIKGLVIDIEDYIYKESSGLAQARKIVYSNMLNINHIGMKSFVKGCQYYICTGFLYFADITHKKYKNFDDLLFEICNEYKLDDEMKKIIIYKNVEQVYDSTIKLLTKMIQLIQTYWK